MSTRSKPVWVWLPGQAEPVRCGTFSLDNGVGHFVYDPAYRQRPGACALDPLNLPFTRSARGLRETRQGGLFGVFRDASPEGFGLAVLASSLVHSGLMSMTAATFENPAPFTFPAFEWRDGQLHEQTPVIRTYPEFVQAFRERGTQWAQFRQQLQEHSDKLDGFVFQQGWWDESVVIRLLRRGWVGAQGEAPPEAPGQISPGFARQIPTAQALLRTLTPVLWP